MRLIIHKLFNEIDLWQKKWLEIIKVMVVGKNVKFCWQKTAAGALKAQRADYQGGKFNNLSKITYSQALQ